MPESVIKRQDGKDLVLDEEESDMASSLFNDNDFEENSEDNVLSDKQDEQEQFSVSGLNNLEDDERLKHMSSDKRGAMVEKAKLLLRLNSVWRGPPTSNGSQSFSVTSKSGKRPNYVVMDGGKVECECPHWKATKICSHALAVAEKEDDISSYLTWYGKQKLTKKRNLTSAANLNVKMSTLGKKGKRPKRQRSKKPPSASIVENTTTRKYKLKWLKDTKAYKCYGCNSAIRIPGEIPDPPNDVIASTSEYRSFVKEGKLQVHYGPTHYHLLVSCILAKNAEFDAKVDLIVTEADEKSMTEAHKRHLKNEFDLVLA